MHNISTDMLTSFAQMSTQRVSSDDCAYVAMKWMNEQLDRVPPVVHHSLIPREWKCNSLWNDLLGTEDGYIMLHKSYHMFDNLQAPHAPLRYVNKKMSSDCKKRVLKEFEESFNVYNQHMNMYVLSRQMVVKLRSLMNIVHFGSFVDEGCNSKFRTHKMHRSALLESINESKRVKKQKCALLIEFERNDKGECRYFMHEPSWRAHTQVH